MCVYMSVCVYVRYINQINCTRFKYEFGDLEKSKFRDLSNKNIRSSILILYSTIPVKEQNIHVTGQTNLELQMSVFP